MKSVIHKTVLAALPAIIGGLYSNVAGASGFQLFEQNASGLGTAYAGSAAVAEDASTVFFNPAGMAFLPAGKKNITVGVDLIKPSVKFSDGGTTNAALQPAGNGNGGDAGSLAPVPHGYFTMPINNKVSFGFGVSAPFGLKTEYDSGWNGRFQAIKSSVETLNLNPSLSFKVNETVALGFGLNYQHIKGEFSSAVNYGAVIAGVAANPGLGGLMAFAPTAGAGTLNISGTDDAWGYNFGAMFQVNPETRLGVSYRSVIKYHITGTASATPNANLSAALGALPAPTAAAVAAGLPTRGGAVYADIKMPDTLILSGLHHLNRQWDIMGDLSWTGWAKIPALTFVYANNNSVLSSTKENWRNTVRVAVGASYKYNDHWKARMGLAYDQSPVPDSTRTPRLPDSDRTWLSLGGQYKPTKDSAVDFAYTHILVKNAGINSNADTASLAYGNILGTYKNSVDIIGVQYSMAF